MKDMVTKKTSLGFEVDDGMQHCSDIAKRFFVHKKKNPSTFTIL